MRKGRTDEHFIIQLIVSSIINDMRWISNEFEIFKNIMTESIEITDSIVYGNSLCIDTLKNLFDKYKYIDILVAFSPTKLIPN
jgi:hypothetical protein